MDQICHDVKCPSCGDIYYETSEAYNPDQMTTGAMLRFKKMFGPEGYNWSLPFAGYDMAEAIVCPECGAALAPNGYIKIENPDGKHFAPEQADTGPAPSQDKKQLPLKKKGKNHSKTHNRREPKNRRVALYQKSGVL